MRRDFIFRRPSGELTLPVTPSEYAVEHGVNVEIVNVYELGDVALVGHGTLAAIKISCLFPANSYPFSDSSDPEEYIAAFTEIVDNREAIRFIVSDTGVNVECYLQAFEYGEQDGTNDIYATLTLRERRDLEVVATVTLPADNTPRASEPQIPAGEETYTAKYGDTLCSICRKYYGNDKPDTYTRLAQYNGKSNPNLLMVGEVLKIPRPLPALQKQTKGVKQSAKKEIKPLTGHRIYTPT